jgi:hypothetical protein
VLADGNVKKVIANFVKKTATAKARKQRNPRNTFTNADFPSAFFKSEVAT